MSSYIMVELTVLDADKMAQYSQAAAPTIAQFGGKFIAKGAVTALHGASSFTNKAIIEFASEELAQQWYQSEEYQALIELRDQAMDSTFQLVAGVQ